ncbi:MAG: hypothetical protein AAF939_09085 [Planctomycetota bacterium]
MAKTALITGVILILIGGLGYLGSDSGTKSTDNDSAVAQNEIETEATESKQAGKSKRSVTALIPAFVGILIGLSGVIALKESARKHAMHVAATFGLLGFLAGASRGMMGIGKFFSGDPSLNQRSFLFVWLMALVCGVFIVLCIKSFRAARIQLKAAAAEGDDSAVTSES